MNRDLNRQILPLDATFLDALHTMNEGIYNIALFEDQDRKLIGIMTDGDFRRAFLAGATPESPVEPYITRNFLSGKSEYSQEANALLLSPRIRYLPILDRRGMVVDILSRDVLKRLSVMEPQFSGNELKYLSDCITQGWISSQGSYVKLFEEQFANLLGASYALTTSSGTTALHLALDALGIGPGDEVIVPDLTFAATVNAVLYTGATPVFVDVCKKTWTLNIQSTQSAITSKTKAVMPVHLYGHPCDMKSLSELAEEHELFLVEDCAESLGAECHGKPTGVIGDVGCFSFFPNKLITTGEGGMVVTNSSDLWEKMKQRRDHGMSPNKRYYHEVVGFNYRMTNLQAAVGVAQLEQIDRFVQSRRKIADAYERGLSAIPGVELPYEEPWAKRICWLYSVKIDEQITGMTAEQVATALGKEGIDTRPIFYPLHEQPPYRQYAEGDFPNTESISRQGISLPSAYNLTEEAIQDVCSVLSQILTSSQTTQIAVLEEAAESESPKVVEATSQDQESTR